MLEYHIYNMYSIQYTMDNTKSSKRISCLDAHMDFIKCIEHVYFYDNLYDNLNMSQCDSKNDILKRCLDERKKARIIKRNEDNYFI